MIYCLDFNSLYPSMYMGGNLYSPVKEGNGWCGSLLYPNIESNDEDGVTGTYSQEQGKIEKVIQWLFNQRKTFPKSDPRNLAYKIVLNTIYGISGSAKFKSVYNLTTASDCTAMARRSIKYARRIFMKNGYECIYTDTDSIYVKDPFNNEKKIMDLAEYISENQRKSFNVYIPTHKLAFESKIKRMYFFRDKDGKFIKKHYIYVTDEDKVVIKGINVKRGNCSRIAKEFFDCVIKKRILDNTFELYDPDILLEELKAFTMHGREDLLQRKYRTKDPSYYKIADGKDEATGLYYQIAKRYGMGCHYLVMNKRIGPGKGIHYATIDELKEKYGDHWIDQILFENYLNDLGEFVNYEKRNFHKVDRKRVEHD